MPNVRPRLSAGAGRQFAARFARAVVARGDVARQHHRQPALRAGQSRGIGFVAGRRPFAGRLSVVSCGRLRLASGGRSISRAGNCSTVVESWQSVWIFAWHGFDVVFGRRQSVLVADAHWCWTTGYLPHSNRRKTPHRGGTILTLGILGLVLCGACGIAAWVMAAEDLKQMRAGRMDRSGEGLTRAGMVLGIISVVFMGFALLIVVAGGLAGHR